MSKGKTTAITEDSELRRGKRRRRWLLILEIEPGLGLLLLETEALGNQA